MAEPFDLIVIGTGAGGSAAAHRCRNAGWRVAVVDELPYGGTCALRGCDPKKVLVGAAELADWHRRMQGRGMAGDARISAHAVQADLHRSRPCQSGEGVRAGRDRDLSRAGAVRGPGPAVGRWPSARGASLCDRSGSEAATPRGFGRRASAHEHRFPRTRPAVGADRVCRCGLHLVRVRPRSPAHRRPADYRRPRDAATRSCSRSRRSRSSSN